MTALLAQCPHCQTSFRVSSSQLKVANGLVRCGACLGVFSAISNEIRVKPPEGYHVEEVPGDPEEHEPLYSGPTSPNPDTPAAAPQNNAESLIASEHPPAPAHASEPEEPMEGSAADTADEVFEVLAAAESSEANPAPTPAELHAEDEQLVYGSEPPLGELSLEDLYVEVEEDAEEVDEDAVDETPRLTAPTPASSPALEDQRSLPDTHESDTVSASLELQTSLEESEPPSLEEESEPLFAELESQSVNTAPEVTITQAPLPDLSVRDDKREIRRKLTQLNEDDELAPVEEEDLAVLDADPITLQQQSYLGSRLGTALLLITNLLLLAALPLPWLYVHKDELATHPRFHFLAPSVCALLECKSRPSANSTTPLYSQQLLVRTHPTKAAALEVSFIFHNSSPEPQPFPDLELAFSSANNQLIANRLFRPEEYLPPELRQSQQVPGQGSVQIQLELADPGPDAVNYKVVLHTQAP